MSQISRKPPAGPIPTHAVSFELLTLPTKLRADVSVLFGTGEILLSGLDLPKLVITGEVLPIIGGYSGGWIIPAAVFKRRRAETAIPAIYFSS